MKIKSTLLASSFIVSTVASSVAFAQFSFFSGKLSDLQNNNLSVKDVINALSIPDEATNNKRTLSVSTGVFSENELGDEILDNAVKYTSRSVSELSKTSSVADLISDKLVKDSDEPRELKLAQSDTVVFIEETGVLSKLEQTIFTDEVIASINSIELEEKTLDITSTVAREDSNVELPVSTEVVSPRNIKATSDNLEDLASNFKLPKSKRELASLSLSSSTRSKRNGVSIATSREEVLKTLTRMKSQNSKIVLEQNYDSSVTNLSLQFIDERSNLLLKDIYPASGVNTAIIGSELILKSDSMGFVHLGELPELSDVLVVSGDENGLYKKTIHEVRTTDKVDSGVTRLKSVRAFSFDMWTQMAGVVEDGNLSQICGQIYSGNLPAEFAEVTLDKESDGVFYFNELGYLDRRLSETSSNGKFCVFNVTPGESILTVNSNSGQFAQIVSSRSSFLTWADLFEEKVDTVLRYGISPSAYEQLSGMKDVKNNINLVDYVNIEVLESESKSEYLESGALVNKGVTRDVNGMVHLTVDAFEIEPSIMRISGPFLEGDYISGFYPRGFVEDIAIMNNISYDSSQGQVIVEYGLLNREDGNNIEIELFDDFGNELSDAKFLDENPVVKAIFFDVPEGRYLSVVKDSEGAWLSSSIVHVFGSRLSIVKTGRQHILNGDFCDIECLSR